MSRARPVSPPVSVRARLGKDPEPGVAARNPLHLPCISGSGGRRVRVGFLWPQLGAQLTVVGGHQAAECRVGQARSRPRALKLGCLFFGATSERFSGVTYPEWVRQTIARCGLTPLRVWIYASKRSPPEESGLRKVVAVPCASLWMYSVMRKTTGMKRPRMTARNAPNDTSRPIVLHLPPPRPQAAARSAPPPARASSARAPPWTRRACCSCGAPAARRPWCWRQGQKALSGT